MVYSCKTSSCCVRNGQNFTVDYGEEQDRGENDYMYSKTCLKRPLKNKPKILMTNGSLIKVESIAECSPFDLH